MRLLFSCVFIGALALLASVAPAAWAATEVIVAGEEPPGRRGGWTLKTGGGYAWTVGGLRGQLNGGGHFLLGAGYETAGRWGLTLELNDQDLGVDRSVLLANGVEDGNARVWSVTLNPTWRFRMGGPLNGYLIGGGGYYHRRVEFTRPAGFAWVPIYDPWWGLGGSALVPVEEVVGRHRQDAAGLNAGMGWTVDLYSAALQLFAELRYHHLFTRHGGTQLLPLTFGLRVRW